jgi:outer membrane biosynthesis protein TonB
MTSRILKYTIFVLLTAALTLAQASPGTTTNKPFSLGTVGSAGLCAAGIAFSSNPSKAASIGVPIVVASNIIAFKLRHHHQKLTAALQIGSGLACFGTGLGLSAAPRRTVTPTVVKPPVVTPPVVTPPSPDPTPSPTPSPTPNPTPGPTPPPDPGPGPTPHPTPPPTPGPAPCTVRGGTDCGKGNGGVNNGDPSGPPFTPPGKGGNPGDGNKNH